MNGVGDIIKSRLPKGDLISVADVAAAMGVSLSKTYALIEDGSLSAMDLGTAEKPYYRVSRASVVAFLDSREAGR